MARTIIIQISEEEEKIMLDMVIDIQDWLMQGPFKEKCANHKLRIAGQMRAKLESEGLTVIPSAEELVKMYFSDPNYKNRKQREEESIIEALKKPK